MEHTKVIAVDFDGCLCKNCYPEIGEPNLMLIGRIKQMQSEGHKFILWTCRGGRILDEAIEFCEGLGLHFDAINRNIPEVAEQFPYTSRKITADEYWDDRAVHIEWN